MILQFKPMLWEMKSESICVKKSYVFCIQKYFGTFLDLQLLLETCDFFVYEKKEVGGFLHDFSFFQRSET